MYYSKEICDMVDIKFVFSNIRSINAKKSSLRPVNKSSFKKETGEVKVKLDEKQIPLFYTHKIRAPKYEHF